MLLCSLIQLEMWKELQLLPTFPSLLQAVEREGVWIEIEQQLECVCPLLVHLWKPENPILTQEQEQSTSNQL
jgi:hypothetical protein